MTILFDRAEAARLHHDEGLTLAEVGEIFGVSRQAVHDALRRSGAGTRTHAESFALLYPPWTCKDCGVRVKREGRCLKCSGVRRRHCQPWAEVAMAAYRRGYALHGALVEAGFPSAEAKKKVDHLRRLMWVRGTPHPAFHLRRCRRCKAEFKDARVSTFQCLGIHRLCPRCRP